MFWRKFTRHNFFCLLLPMLVNKVILYRRLSPGTSICAGIVLVVSTIKSPFLTMVTTLKISLICWFSLTLFSANNSTIHTRVFANWQSNIAPKVYMWLPDLYCILSARHVTKQSSVGSLISYNCTTNTRRQRRHSCLSFHRASTPVSRLDSSLLALPFPLRTTNGIFVLVGKLLRKQRVSDLKDNWRRWAGYVHDRSSIVSTSSHSSRRFAEKARKRSTT